VPPLHIHFETRRNKPKVFKITRELVDAAWRRNKVPSGIEITVGGDLVDATPLTTATALVCSNDIVTDPLFRRAELAATAPNLRWIHIIGAGVEPLLPLEWLPTGTILTNNSGVHSEKISEFATMALLMLNARMPEIMTNQTRRHWQQIFTPTIKGKTVLVVGLGDMGSAAARAAKKIGLKVIGVRRQCRPHRFVDEVVELSKLPAAIQRADIIFVTAPLTPQSRHLIDREMLAKAKAGAGLINVGRAGVVDYEALRSALASGALSGAILDVFDPEPLPSSSPLWTTPHLIMLPHCSSDDLDGYIPKTLDLVCENLRRLSSGRPLKNVVDRERGY
jgi:phosphoglycerate dehydrogenase-like enzyme